jgi:Tfp pilus assembly protein PilN
VSQQINLFNPLFLKQKKYFSLLTMLQALGLLLLGVVAFYGFALWQDSILGRQALESSYAYEQQKQRFAKAAAELNPEKREAELERDLKAVEEAIAARRALLRQLQTGAMGNAAGYSEYLRALARQTVPGLWLTSIQIVEGGDQLALSGRALHADLIPVLIRKLKAEAVLRGRTLEALSISQSGAGTGPPRARTVVDFTVNSKAQPEGAAAAAPERGKGKS